MDFNSRSLPFGGKATLPPQAPDSQPWPVHGSVPMPKQGPGPYLSAPPPMGYPSNNGGEGHSRPDTLETKRKGDGFWKGCCAALCCCCVLDACF